MIDWTGSMEQTFEYYEVNPKTWNDIKKMNNIKSANISWDYDADTLGSASFSALNIFGETYIRIYLIIIQNGVTNKIPLGVFLLQTPNSTFDGKVNNVSIDAYTPLKELKEKILPIGYTTLKDSNILESVYNLVKDNCRCPVVKTISDKKLNSNFVANYDDSCIKYLNDLLLQADYKIIMDENSKILFEPIIPIESLQPRFTFNDDNSSILLPDISINHDLYDIPNVVEVIHTDGNNIIRAISKNKNENSPTSIQQRGREIIHRVTDPKLPGTPSQEQLNEYAEKTLRNLSNLEYTVSFSHAYCPVRVGDCVRLNYKKAGLQNIKAKIIRQSIKCNLGCEINTTAVFTKNLL